MNIPIQSNIPLSTLSTFGIGGLAKKFIAVDSTTKLLEVIRWANNRHLPFRVFAGGSNIVFPDEGTSDLLIQYLSGDIQERNNIFIADAGINLMKAIHQAISRGLAGLETLSGIPGTLGGAVVGNAGAYGHSLSECVDKVEIWDGEKRHWIDNTACKFSYRQSIFKEQPYLVLHVELNFRPGSRKKLQQASTDIIHLRERKYRPGLKCPGSFFKNVLVKDVSREALSRINETRIIDGKIPAGYLLASVGACGMKVGGIGIADFHGNLFINRGGGKAKDVKQLATILKKRVREHFAVELEEEIRYF